MILRLVYRLYQFYLFFARPVTLGVRIVLLRRQEVLLVRQTYMDGWFIPGGGVKKGETLEQAARREAREEVKAELRAISLLGIYSNFREWKSDHNAVFLSQDFSLAGGHDNEVAEIRFFPLDRLPKGLWPGHKKRLLELRRASKSARHGPPYFGKW